MQASQTLENIEISKSLIDIHVGIRVSELRETAQMSLSLLADRLGVSADVINAWERGNQRVPPAQLISMTTVFSCSLMAFFDGLSVDDQSNSGGKVIL